MPEAAKRLVWDETGKKFYETGISNGVLYVQDEGGLYPKGVVWNGLTAVNENPSGAEASPLWADDIKYLNLVSTEEFGASIEAYTYPEEFNQCDGNQEIIPGLIAGQQNRKPFGLSYKTVIGNDTENASHGYKLHLIYGCSAAPSQKGYKTQNDNPEAITFSWEVKTTPVPVEVEGQTLKPTATLTIDSRKFSPEQMKAIEDALWGSSSANARLPLPAEVKTILDTAAAA